MEQDSDFNPGYCTKISNTTFNNLVTQNQTHNLSNQFSKFTFPHLCEVFEKRNLLMQYH